ncbi:MULTISPECIES: PQQ-binding-like beta-propeller repeat protein [unclassified Streptomyces]|uniref:outer membrane protein assembly factor BamB family protein n=1 Tax=unclassified Streptomyces TaxID=2593676 RepID=UPI003D711A27
MTTSPPPHQPPQGSGPGTPEDQPPQNPPQTPPAPPMPPSAPAAPGAPDLTKAPDPGYGYPQAPQPSQAPQPPHPAQSQPQQGQQGRPPQQPDPYSPFPQQPPAPSGPYAAQPGHGYGYPAAQPGYGYPVSPGAHPTPSPQPGYGYPGQPGQPGQPTVPFQAQPPAGSAPGGGGSSRAPLYIIVAAVVAIALIIGGGIWYSSSTGDDGKKNQSSGGTGGDNGKGDGGTSGSAGTSGSEKVPSDPASKVLFQLPMPAVGKDDTIAVDGSWLTDKAYVKSGVAEVVAYDRDTGAKLWTIKLPGPVCEATPHITKDFRTAIVYEPSMPAKNRSAGCSQVAALDLAAGKKLWNKTVNSGDYPINFDNVTVSANTVAVGSTDGGAAFDIASGKVLWQPKTSDTCYDAGYGGGAKLVAVRKCGSYDARQLHIQTIDPASGQVQSEYKMTQDIEYASVVSTDPLVVAADVGDSAGDGSGISDFFSIDNRTGQLRTRISAPGDQFAADCDSISRVEDCTGIAVGGDRLYLPTEEHDSSGDHGRSNEVIAFDLATGKQTGQRADSGDGWTITPLRMDGGNVIAYLEPPYDKGGRVVSIDGGSFKTTTLMQNPDTEAVRDMESDFSPEYDEVLYADGRLYLAEVYADAPLREGDKKYLALAFGRSG